jgi:hypothetical protein
MLMTFSTFHDDGEDGFRVMVLQELFCFSDAEACVISIGLSLEAELQLLICDSFKTCQLHWLQLDVP